MKKVIIVGCGRVGSRIAIQLYKEGYDVSVIDRNPLAFDKLENQFDGRMIVGTGLDQEALINAGIEKADSLITVAKGDNTNIMVGQIAQCIFKVPKVVVRIVDPRCKEFYQNEMGLNCYCQTETSSDCYIKMIKEA